MARRSQARTDIWPGFVDALATLLMVIIFLLMIFVLAQFFLNEALSGRDAALDRLKSQVSELADLLALERSANTDLRTNIAQISEELQASVSRNDDLSQQLRALTLHAESAEQRAVNVEADLQAALASIQAAEERAGRLDTELAESKKTEEQLKAEIAAALARSRQLDERLADAFKTIEADKEKIELKLREIADLSRSVEALKALRSELETQISEMAGKVEEKDKALLAERELSESARAQMALLNQQIRALRQQLAQLEAALDASEELAEKQKVQIANLGQRLNAALASKVEELSRYRSEFFGRLRTLLSDEQGIRIVGDRFVFQSEVLFGLGSDEIADAGRSQLARLSSTLKEISGRIPENIDWILRVDGHTDNLPIRTPRFPSNWELSTARAISVVKFLIDQGIPAERLAATGFGEFQPLDGRDDEIGRRRNRRIELKLTQR